MVTKHRLMTVVRLVLQTFLMIVDGWLEKHHIDDPDPLIPDKTKVYNSIVAAHQLRARMWAIEGVDG